MKCLKYAQYDWLKNFTIFPYDNIYTLRNICEASSDLYVTNNIIKS